MNWSFVAKNNSLEFSFPKIKARWNRYITTVAPRNTGSQGTKKFHLLLADFRYCQYRELKEMTWRDQSLTVKPRFTGPRFAGPLTSGIAGCNCTMNSVNIWESCLHATVCVWGEKALRLFPPPPLAWYPLQPSSFKRWKRYVFNYSSVHSFTVSVNSSIDVQYYFGK